MSGQPQQGRVDELRSSDRPRQHTGGSDAELAILRATEQLLADVPLHDLSVAQIIRAAGISRATFYFYFSSKFAVLTALVEQAINEIYTVSRPTLDRSGGVPIETLLHQRIEDSAKVWDAHRPVLQATVENWHVYPELRALWLKMIGGLTDAIAAEIDRERAAGRAPAGTDSRQLAAMLAWTTERCLYVIGLDLPESLGDGREMVAVLTKIWLATMYGSAYEHQAAA